MGNEIPRRNNIDLNTPAELAIQDAIHQVENMGADEKLTAIVVMLDAAKDLLSDFIDEQ